MHYCDSNYALFQKCEIHGPCNWVWGSGPLDVAIYIEKNVKNLKNLFYFKDVEIQ